MEFGFSYVGLVYLLMLFLPNLLWTRCRPAGYEAAGQENRVLLVLERAGEVLTTCSVLVFRDFNLRPCSLWILWLAASFVAMLLYEGFWIRYFHSARQMEDFYAPLLGIPMAGAVLPVAAFGLLAVYGRNPVLLTSASILGIGHIGIHLGHRRALKAGI